MNGSLGAKPTFVLGLGLGLGLALSLLSALSPAISHAQTREPLCVHAEARRLLAGPGATARHLERMVLEPLHPSDAATAGAPRYALAVRDRGGSLRTTAAPARDASEMNYARTRSPAQGASPASAPGLTVLRLDSALRPVGDAVFVPDPARAPDASAPAIIDTSAQPRGVALSSGVLVLERLGPGDLYATVVPPRGEVPAPRLAFQAPALAPEHGEAAGPGGVWWFSLTARGDGALALAGLTDGRVFALRFDRQGATVGAPIVWDQRVGGPLELMPISRAEDSPVAALLGRPVRGTGPDNEQARVQVLVNMDAGSLQPSGVPAATGFAQFPLASAMRGRTLTVVQWAQEQGVAVAQMLVGDRRVAESLPRVYRAIPPLDGAHAGHDMTLGADNVLFDLATYAEPAGGGLHGNLAWIPPGGVPVVRRDVLPARMHLSSGPRVLPARDGAVLVLAGQDETGSAVDAFHLRCDLVTVPAATDAPAATPAPAP